MSVRNSYISAFMLLAASATCGSALISCSDNPIVDEAARPVSDGGKQIRFSVGVADTWHQGASRGNIQQGAPLPAIALKDMASDSTLWLIPAVNDGFGSDDLAASRASAVTTETMERFGVFASLKPAADTPLEDLSPDYMHNVEVTEANGWMPAEEYLWPGKGTLHFNAYAPFRTDPDQKEGIVSLPAADAMGELTLGFVTPSSAASQFDLLRSIPVEAQSSPCNLEFTHALTAVRFSTGSEMMPCKVVSVAVTGVLDRATLNLETGEWTDASGSGSFTVSPGIVLSAASGSEYVAPDTPVTTGDSTLMLLPQSLSEEARIALTIESAGTVSTFEASLEGQTWTAGKTVVYHLSASVESGGLILQVLDADGNPLKSIDTPYTGKSVPFTVKSYYSDSESGTQQPVEWKTSFIAADGTELTAAPGWITTYPSGGSGQTAETLTTDVIEPVFEAMSEPTKNLRQAADINATSGHNPYNLASSTGDPASVENTANCYLINAPGTYSIPLVYGNAIKGGAENSAAYISTQKASRTVLSHFINHLGNEITSPYIYENSGCEPEDAVLVWEGRLCVTRNVRLSADHRSLLVDIPAGFIRQANAVVAVRDKAGAIMWSWHLWITDYTPEWVEVPNPEVAGLSYYMFTRSLGRIVGGDITDFEEANVTMRLTQTDVPEGQTPLTVDIPVNQGGKSIIVNDCYSFYQWSRKDPVVSGIEEYYTADHVEHASSALSTASFSSDYKTQIENSILHPSIFYTSESNAPFYLNLWNINGAKSSLTASNPVNIKTIYDPSPVGGRVPLGNVFEALMSYHADYDSETRTVTFMAADGTTPMITFPVLGYRGREGSVTLSQYSPFWSAEGRNGQGRALSIAGSTVNLVLNTLTEGFGIHPAKE